MPNKYLGFEAAKVLIFCRFTAVCKLFLRKISLIVIFYLSMLNYLIGIILISLRYKIENMFIVISFMFLGIFVGYFTRQWKLRFVHRFVLTLVWLLLFLLGLEVGANETVVNQFGRLGFEAFLLALGATFGSVFFAWLLWLTLRHKSDKL